MAKTYAPLTVLPLKPGVTFVHPIVPPTILHWDDPALHAMLDFKYLKADTITADEPIDFALLHVKNSFSHISLVVDKEQRVVGLISVEDLLGEKPVKTIHERRLARKDVVVRMVMTPNHEILVMDFEDLRHAKVGHIIETLRLHKQHYAVVIKYDENHHPIIRGLFSASLLSRQLGQDVMSNSMTAHTIAELQHDLHLHD
jgi:hypothetical protein